MISRSIAHILKGEKLNVGAADVKQPLPTTRVDQISPFLLLHHFGPNEAAPGEDPLGVGPHPHRGFEPVTFLYRGGIRHKDSRGNEGILADGDVQWMTAGMGIIHSEMSSEAFLENGGVMEGIQLWINLPQRYKMVQPRYQDIKASEMPRVPVADDRVQLTLVAGELDGQRGPAQTFTPILAVKADFQAGGETFIPIPEDFNAMAYILSGDIELSSGFSYPSETLLHFKNDGEGFLLKAKADSRVLILAGAPIDEPVAQWGPFVMNTQTEIMQAMRDYQMGKMGVYID
ncbi:MAG TPA: pirin family protein [Saprospiraceae bacterium]|nr:pirin family protein [Saprospiraceae bacterium]HMP22815.1 pirin family protein [Saprospiraceae bacterium]